MTNKKLMMIPVLIAALLIPQLLFWWLVPAAVVARLVIYIGGTILTMSAGGALFTTYWKSNIRKVSGLVALVSALEVGMIVGCSLMVILNVTIRSAVYALVIMGLIHLVCMVPMIISVLIPEVGEVVPIQIPVEDGTAIYRETNHGRNVVTNHDTVMTTRRELSLGGTASAARRELPPRNR